MTKIYYVSINGDDNNPGTIDQPFKTIYKGISTAIEGDTVHVLAGTYYPTFSTRPVVNKSINLTGDGKINTIIDGTNITGWQTDWRQGLVEIRADSVTFSGFTVQNVIADSTTGQGASGVCVIDAQNIIVENNRIYNIWSSGIQLRGTVGSISRNLIVRRNEIDHASCGGDPSKSRQEVLSVGNYVDMFDIYYNYIHTSGYTIGGNINGGCEGLDVKDGASNGKIHHNYVYDTRNVGIYIDGYSRYCNDIDVYDNIVESVYDTEDPTGLGVGIAISTEAGGSAQRINFYDNIVYANRNGFFLYLWHGPSYPYSEIGITDIVFNNNVVYDDNGASISVQKCLEHLDNIQITNNYVMHIWVESCYQSVTVLSGNITDPTSVINEFNARYNILKNDILNNINELRRNKQTVNILTNVGYISIDKLRTLLVTAIISESRAFSVVVTHLLTDANNGKTFVIPNFPTSCIIKEIRIRSNFVSGKQDLKVAFINNTNGIAPIDTNISCDTDQIFDVGDYICIENEIAYVNSVDAANNMITVVRGVVGTTISYHNYGARIETANYGLRLVLFKNSSRKLVDRLKIIPGIMSWKGTTNVVITMNDKIIKFANSPLNIDKYDILYIIDGNNSERSSVEDANGMVANGTYDNTIYVADPLLAHAAGIDVQKQDIYDMPIVFSGGDGNLYCTLYVDEKIDSILYSSGITVIIEVIVDIFDVK